MVLRDNTGKVAFSCLIMGDGGNKTRKKNIGKWLELLAKLNQSTKSAPNIPSWYRSTVMNYHCTTGGSQNGSDTDEKEKN